MDRRVVQRILGAPDPQESRALLECLGPKPGDIQKLLPGHVWAVFAAVTHNGGGERRTYPRNITQQVLACSIQLHADAVDAVLDSVVQFLLKQFLVHVVLVLTDAERFRVYFDEFRERVHQAPAYRHGTAHRNVLIRELFAGGIGGGINGSPVFAD